MSFFDIDDTLRTSKTGLYSTTIPTVFKQLREKGILTGIASGRGIFSVVPEIRELKPDFFCNLNGAYIEDKKVRSFINIRLTSQMLWSTFLDEGRGIEYGLVGSHDAKLSTRNRTDQ